MKKSGAAVTVNMKITETGRLPPESVAQFKK